MGVPDNPLNTLYLFYIFSYIHSHTHSYTNISAHIPLALRPYRSIHFTHAFEMCGIHTERKKANKQQTKKKEKINMVK